MENGFPRQAASRRACEGLERWHERSGRLYDEMRAQAVRMVRRGYGASVTEADLDDIYNAAWTSSFATLSGRADTMSDGEVQRYVLTAVAHSAARELRRRGRKPVASIDLAWNVAAHDPPPEERATGKELAALVRDLLESLPERRRTVLVLRYAWGLEPAEICELVDGLSHRAYRKEIERGVRQLAEALAAAEAGSWCEERREQVIELVSGTATDRRRTQAERHLEHCHSCRGLARSLRRGLMGAELVIPAVLVGAAGAAPASAGPLERLGAIAGRARDQLIELSGRSGGEAEVLSALPSAASARGAGSGLLAGAAAKLAGLGGAAKLATACLATGAAATACVAAGAVAPPLDSLLALERGDRVDRLEEAPAELSAIAIPPEARGVELAEPEREAVSAVESVADEQRPEAAAGEAAAPAPASEPAVSAEQPIERVASAPAEVPSVELAPSAVTARPARPPAPPSGPARARGPAEFGP